MKKKKKLSKDVTALAEPNVVTIPARPTSKNFKIPETDKVMEALIKAMEKGGAIRSEAE